MVTMGLRLRSALLVAGSLAAAGSSACGQPSAGFDSVYYPDHSAMDGAVYVHLFEWKWLDIARECQEWLGPKGFHAVQISPPNEHIPGPQWWTRYQPVSYRLDSRGGTRAELIEMVERCAAAGVDVYADLVINHTAAGAGGVGWAGSSWTTRNHPDIPYQTADYHQPCSVTNYGDAANVQNCSLVGLPDLATENPYVQDRIAAYIQDLTGIGVAGFRIDAAKHIATLDIQAILDKVGYPYVYQEVIGSDGEAVQPIWYVNNGQITEFAFSRRLGQHFLDGWIGYAHTVSNYLLPGTSAVVFTDNHDNQRGHGAGYRPVTHKDGPRYALANAFMLAWPYGYPRVMSSYEFGDDGDQGPPDGASGCDRPRWICEHRWTTIANMVGFRRVTHGEPVRNGWDDGGNQIAFSRGDKGFIAINNHSSELVQTLQTGMPEGTYCDIATGDYSAATSTCSGRMVTVDSAGMVSIRVAPLTALAIHAGARVGGPAAR